MVDLDRRIERLLIVGRTDIAIIIERMRIDIFVESAA